VHFNAGGSFFPDVNDRDLWNDNLGGSAIYAVTQNFNLMPESVANWDQDVDSAKDVDRTLAALISPGVRYAFNLPDDVQIVAGAAVPSGLTSDSPDWGFSFISRSSIRLCGRIRAMAKIDSRTIKKNYGGAES
jgi:hypothetical protein